MAATVTRLDPVRTVHVVVKPDPAEALCIHHFNDYARGALDAAHEADGMGEPDMYLSADQSTPAMVLIAMVPDSKMAVLRTTLEALAAQYAQKGHIRFAVIENTELL